MVDKLSDCPQCGKTQIGQRIAIVDNYMVFPTVLIRFQHVYP